MKEGIFLAGAVRTPIGRFGGALAPLPAVELGVAAAAAAMNRAGIAPDAVDEVVFGHARQAGCGPNPGRQVGVKAGIPVGSPAKTINQACLSGFQAILDAARAIRGGEAQIVLAGGMESMSRVPYLLPVPESRWGMRMGHREVVDGMYRDGFLDPICGKVMGETAETLATQYAIPREEQDAYAAQTQQRCEAARREGRFAEEIVALDKLAADEHPRDGVTAAALAKLPAVFSRDGTVTAGNSSGITDGAAAMIVLSESAVGRLGVKPLARLVDWTVVGVEPAVMGIGPVPAVRRLSERTGVPLASVDLVELNEAFAAQVLAVDRELRFDRERLNVNGGSIALGHPIGCSGARIVVTLLHEMRRRGVRRGLATLCVSGGLGGALLVEAA
ncbi:MAG TPA: acetyl-CoA C-acetyltransferase [Candidatus Polarisedimenticolaceae bacterium]